MELKSQEMRKLAPELDPLRIGTGWKKEDLGKVQVMVESTYGDSHPGSGHLNILVEEVRKGIEEEGGYGARYYCTDICDGESQGTDGINYSLASREMIANMIEIHENATPFDAGVYLSSCDKGMPGNLMGLARVNIPAVVVPGGTMNAGPEMLTLEQQEKVFEEFVKQYPNLKCIARHVRYAQSCSENSLKAYLWLDGKTYESNTLSFHILDRVGGGDAFVSGIIYGLMNQYKPEDVVNFGVAASAVKHTIHGDGNITDDVSLIQHVMQMNFDIKR